MTHRIAAWTLATALVATASLVGAARQSAAPQQNASAERQLEAAIHREQVLGDVKGAIEQYKALAKGANRSVAAQALVRLGECYEKLGESQFKEARSAYDRVLREFGDQGEVVERARARLAALGRPRNTSEVVARLILRDSGEATGHLSADGKLLRRIDAPTGDLIQFDLAAGQASRVTNSGGPDAKQPPMAGTVFSRSGKQVDASYDTSKDGITSQLRVRNLDGSGLRTLYSETGIYAVAVDWSEDGASLLAIRINTMAKGPLELILLSAADGSARVLTRMPPSSVSYQGFKISPDGRHVAFSYVREGNPAQADISVMTTDGRDEAVVAGHPADDRLRAWTPDGRGLLFVSDRSGGWDLWMVPIAAGRQHGEPEVVKKSFGDAELLGVTPDGSSSARPRPRRPSVPRRDRSGDRQGGRAACPGGHAVPERLPHGRRTAKVWPMCHTRAKSGPATTS